MLWALVSSAYVIFLYRKLKGQAEPSLTVSTHPSDDVDAALDTLDRRLVALEARVAGREKDSVR